MNRPALGLALALNAIACGEDGDIINGTGGASAKSSVESSVDSTTSDSVSASSSAEASTSVSTSTGGVECDLDTSLSHLSDKDRAHLDCIVAIRKILNEQNAHLINNGTASDPLGVAVVCAEMEAVQNYAACLGAVDSVYTVIIQESAKTLGITAQDITSSGWFAYNPANGMVEKFQTGEPDPDPTTLSGTDLCGTMVNLGPASGNWSKKTAVTGDNQTAIFCGDCSNDLNCVCEQVKIPAGPEGADKCEP